MAPSAEAGSFGDVRLSDAKTVTAALRPGHLAAIAGRAMDLPEFSSHRLSAASHPPEQRWRRQANSGTGWRAIQTSALKSLPPFQHKLPPLADFPLAAAVAVLP